MLAAIVGSGIMGERLAGGNVAIALLANTLATGATLVALILTFGGISGAHFNPAITFAFLVTRRIKPALAVIYWAAQLAGGTLGALLVQQLLPRASTDPVALGVPAIGHGVNAGAALELGEQAIFYASMHKRCGAPVHKASRGP